MSRLIVVSNRVPSPDSSAGGLAAGLEAALSETGGVWFGWSGKVAERGDHEVRLSTRGPFSLATIDLRSGDYEGYYNGIANRTLWPLFHSRVHLTSYDADTLPAYRRVNRIFGHKLQAMIAADDLIWVQDYHLIPLGRELRRLGVRAPLGFFLHIPFPPPEALLTLPWHEDLVDCLCAYDLVGFQSHRDYQNFRDFITRELGGEVNATGNAQVGSHSFRADVFPIGIDTQRWARVAASSEVEGTVSRLRADLQGLTAILGVDRLDYTKGLPQRFRAVESLLMENPRYRNRICLLQVATPSRQKVPEYQELRAELEGIAGRMTGALAELDWKPLHYLNKCFSPTQLAALYRYSRVGLVTPLRDGMNLVAKEYVASQAPRDPGVLILSRFAGAAEQMGDALIVNPYDEQEVAAAIITALEMPLEERHRRWLKLMEDLRRNTVSQWRSDFLETLEEAHLRRAGDAARDSRPRSSVPAAIPT